MSDYIPVDVLSDILARLTAEDLVRCTAVCWKWHDLIRSPSFISEHLKRSVEDKDRNHLLLRYQTAKPSTDHYSLRVVNNNTFREHKEFSIPYPLQQIRYRIVGICNGLICFDAERMIFLWNPVIRKAVKVSNPNEYSVFLLYSIGFGFDSLANDYKIVRINHPNVKVYSLNAGCWRDVSHKAPSYKLQKGSQQAYVCGAAHWIGFARSSHGTENLIAAFDMKEEIFREMPVPESLRRFDDAILQLHVYRESISLFNLIPCDDAILSCTMWLMKEYGAPNSWTKQFTVDLQTAAFDTSIGVRPNGQVLFVSWDGALISYDYEKNVVSDVKFRGSIVFGRQGFYLGAYNDSLVLLDKGTDFDDMVVREISG